MANPSVIVWPVVDTAAISALQNVAGNGSFIINGTLASNGQVNLTGSHINRTVSFTSADDNHLATFTVTGTLDGFAVTGTATGLNANTVYTTQQFDVITSVTVNNHAVTNVSIGTGLTGSTDWILNNIYLSPFNLGIQVEVVATTIKYSFDVTLDDITLFSPSNVFVSQPITALTTATTSQLGVLATPVLYYRVSVLDTATTNATGTLQATFIQQGLV